MPGWNDDAPSIFAAMNALMDARHQVAYNIPNAPPASESIKLSVKS
jgi:hypothetical protein